jgi:hypothetical protein
MIRIAIFLLAVITILINQNVIAQDVRLNNGYSSFVYLLWEKEARTFGFPDSSEQDSRMAVDGHLELMFRNYLKKKGDAKALQRNYPQIGQLTDYWEEPMRNQLSFRQFRNTVSSALISKYRIVGNNSSRKNELAIFEKEVIYWIGDFIKTTSYYSEKVFAYYYKRGDTPPRKFDDAATSLHTLLAGRDGNVDRRRYNCESYSKGMVLLAGQFGLNSDAVSIITVIKDYKGKIVNQKIVENGISKEIGHVCNLITLNNGTRIYYDQGIAMDPRYEHQIVVAYDNIGNSYELYSSNDSLWTNESSILGQTIGDMSEINRLDDYLSGIEKYISEKVKTRYTDPDQTEKMRAIYSDISDDLKKLSYNHLRVIGTDIVKEKAKAVSYELQYQIDQLDDATGKLTLQKNENQKVKEFNSAINQYNQHNEQYRLLIARYKNDLPVLKSELKPLRRDCLARRDNYRSQKGFMGKTVKSADGRVLRFASVVEQYDHLIGNIDYILELPGDIKYLNIK